MANAPDLHTIEAKPYVPARDFALSLRFYQALGFAIVWSSDDLAHLRHGASGFLLQRFFVPGHARNFQMHLLVRNADDWHRHIQAQRIAEDFGVDLGEPEDRPWGLRDFTLFDPGGVLWRIGHALVT